MNLKFNTELADGYHSKSQMARVLTEDWIAQNMFCPRCGHQKMKHFENNRPVADFYCPQCVAQYELKSKNGDIGKKVNDGAYDTMISRITSRDNPDFLFLSYSMSELVVKNLIFVPKHFFAPSVIEKRKPLAPTARRAGWTGCNIMLNQIPAQGRITIIHDGHAVCWNSVVEKVKKAQQLSIDSITERGWLFDILNCVNGIQSNEFDLVDMYRFESILAKSHPGNNNIRPKIRQQLQLLRDKGVIEFLGRGKYRKCL